MLQQIGPPLLAFLISVLRLCSWLTVLAVVFIPLERLCAIHPQKILRKGMLTDVGYYFLSGLLPAVLLSVPVGLLAWFVHLAVPGSFLAATAALPFWARALAGLVVGEIGYYWGHRWSHEIPFLWSFHSIHHSAEHVDFMVSTRGHPVDVVFGRFCGLVPMYVLGLASPAAASGSLVPVVVTLVGMSWGFFIHANLRWRFGPLEWLISTPGFHHWHHTLTGPINRNYASTLPWLDWIFGTLHLPRNEWPESYGINAKLPDSLLGQLAYPLQSEEPPATLDRQELVTSRDDSGQDSRLSRCETPS